MLSRGSLRRVGGSTLGRGRSLPDRDRAPDAAGELDRATAPSAGRDSDAPSSAPDLCRMHSDVGWKKRTNPGGNGNANTHAHTHTAVL